MIAVIWMFIFVNHVIMIVNIQINRCVFHMYDILLVDLVNIIHLYKLLWKTFFSFFSIIQFMDKNFSINANLCWTNHSTNYHIFNIGRYELFERNIIAFSFFIVYILPSLINSYGKIFSLAELLENGYATLLSNGVSMPSYFNIPYYANSGPCS
jgi:hypothetical protein